MRGRVTASPDHTAAGSEACPNCWVICDTTRKTIQIYKGVDAYPMPEEVGARLRAALKAKMRT